MRRKREASIAIEGDTQTRTQRQLAVEEVLPLPHLPHHLTLQVLSWLPPKAIIRFRSVCKLWFSALADSKFIQQHLSNHRKDDTASRIVIPTGMIGATLQHLVLPDYFNAETIPNRSGGIIIDNRDNWPRIDWRIFGTCNGLFCYAAQGSIMLCNPSIPRTIPLPNCPFFEDINNIHTNPNRNFSCGMGFDQVEDGYKVVVIKRKVPLGAGISKAIIFSLNSNSWRRVEGVIPVTWTFGKSFFLHGFIHWLSRVVVPNGHEKTCLIVFNVSNEVFGEMNLPFGRYGGHMAVSVLKGRVCTVMRGEDNNGWEMWTMNEYGVNESWAMQYRVDAARLPGVSTFFDIPFVSFEGYLIYNYADHESDGTIRSGPHHQYYYSNYTTLDPSDFPTIDDYVCWYKKHMELPRQFIIYDFKTGKYSNLCRAISPVPEATCVEATLELMNYVVN